MTQHLLTLLVVIISTLHAVSLYKYKIDRSVTDGSDTIRINLRGDANDKCVFHLLTHKNDTLLYEPIKVQGAQELEVSCKGLYNFVVPHPRDIYYIKLKSSSSQASVFLTLRHIFEKPVFAKAFLEDKKIKFSTFKLCSSDVICQIRENNIPIKYIAASRICNHYGSLSTEFTTTKDRLKLYCGNEQSPLYVYVKDTHLLENQQAKQFAVTVSKGNPNTKLEIKFANPDPSEICEFKVKEGNGADWNTNCGYTPDAGATTVCFRKCDNVTMTITAGAETSYTLYLKTKHMVSGFENTYIIGKNEIEFEDKTHTTITLRLDLLAEAGHICEMSLFHTKYPGYEMKHICGEDGEKPCDNHCTVKTLQGLIPRTEYRLVVKRKEGQVISLIFKTDAAELVNIKHYSGPNSVVIHPSTDSLAHKTYSRCIHSDRCVNTCNSVFEVIGLKPSQTYDIKVFPFSHYEDKFFQITTASYLNDFSVELTDIGGGQIKANIHGIDLNYAYCDFSLYAPKEKENRLQLAKFCDYTTDCSVECKNGFIFDTKTQPSVSQFNVRVRHFGVSKSYAKKPKVPQYVNLLVSPNNDPYIEEDFETVRLSQDQADNFNRDEQEHMNPVHLTIDDNTHSQELINIRRRKKRTADSSHVIHMDTTHSSNQVDVNDNSNAKKNRKQRFTITKQNGVIHGKTVTIHKKDDSSNQNPNTITSSTKKDKAPVSAGQKGSAAKSSSKETPIIAGVIMLVIVLLLIAIIGVYYKKYGSGSSTVYAVAHVSK